MSQRGLSQVRVVGGGTSRNYYGYDGLGSVRRLFNTAGTLTERYDYDAWGNVLAASPAPETPNHYRFAGEQWDADLGLYYNRARYYAPQLGRFWNMDSYEGSSSDPA